MVLSVTEGFQYIAGRAKHLTEREREERREREKKRGGREKKRGRERE